MSELEFEENPNLAKELAEGRKDRQVIPNKTKCRCDLEEKSPTEITMWWRETDKFGHKHGRIFEPRGDKYADKPKPSSFRGVWYSNLQATSEMIKNEGFIPKKHKIRNDYICSACKGYKLKRLKVGSFEKDGAVSLAVYVQKRNFSGIGDDQYIQIVVAPEGYGPCPDDDCSTGASV